MLDIFLFLFSLLAGLSTMIVIQGLVLGITIPFMGVLIRYRANYSPKRLQLAADDGAPTLTDHDEHGSPNSYLGMMKRVYNIEGWSGLYKGIMPSFISSFIAAVAVIPIAVFLALDHRVLPGGRVSMHRDPQADTMLWTILGFALSVLPVLLLIPMQIITNRAITTTHKLHPFAPKAALRVLLSPAERAHPLTLYLAPGVALAETLQGLILPALRLLRLVARPHLHLSTLPLLSAALPITLLAAALLTPLQVMATRLMLQRHGAAPDAEADTPPAYADVMEFRGTQEAPYTGLLDCGRQIVREEGWRVLFRAYWITLLGMGMMTM
ncbi:mitochondrial carrier domain-containing protein [Mycena sp. CBHHK59/15]|nr:mitochondrial carrier domain-containing protein [Mycena sp. CBHHK59/15]